MRTYVGFPDKEPDQSVVFYDGTEAMASVGFLDPGYQHGVNHSPDGFSWGYGGSGPAQLAFALLLDACGLETALKHYQRFKWGYVAKLDQKAKFRITDKEIRKMVSQMERVNDEGLGESAGPSPEGGARGEGSRDGGGHPEGGGQPDRADGAERDAGPDGRAQE